MAKARLDRLAGEDRAWRSLVSPQAGVLGVAREGESRRLIVDGERFHDAAKEVLALKDLAPTAYKVESWSPAQTVPFSGVHPAAMIFAAEFGAISCLLGSGGEPTHLLTAGHIFAEGAQPGTPVYAAGHKGGALRKVGVLVVDFLDTPPIALGRTLDAALVELLDAGTSMIVASGEKIPRLEDALPFDELSDKLRVRAYRPMTGQVSEAVKPVEDEGTFDLSSSGGGIVSARDVYRVRDVLFASIPTKPGDSGCPLVSVADPLGVGICIGAPTDGPEGTIFESMYRALLAAREQPGCAGLGLWAG